MKNLLFFLMMIASFLVTAQTYDHIYVGVWDNNFTGVPNQLVFVKVYNGTTLVHNSRGYSDSTSFGGYSDSIPSSLVFDSIVSYTFDCSGNKLRGVASPMPTSPWGMYEDTIWQSCPINSFAGQVGLNYTQSSTVANSIDFTDNSIRAGFSGTNVTLFCDFGDNDSSVVSSNFSHTYPGPGKYYIQYSFSEYDIAGKGYNTQNWFRDTIEVLPFIPTSFCQASYWVDTLNSGNNVALIYNNSTPSQKDTNYSNTYHWDFGDGDTSNLPYPTHTYSNAGLYQVCLTVDSKDSSGITCTSTFCDSLGIDTTGALLYKSSSFSLQVLEPTIGFEELESASYFKLYPNPVDDFIIVSGLDNVEGRGIQYSVYSINGALLMNGKLENIHNEERINLNELGHGFYIFRLTSGGKFFNYQIVKQ